MRKTKIVATLGPATDGFLHHAPAGGETIRQMMIAGMDVARMNMSHQDADTHRRRAADIRRLSDELAHPTAILVDTKGPEIRLGPFSEGRVVLQTGQRFLLTGQPVAGTSRQASVSHSGFADDVPPGTRILIDDGKIVLQAEERQGDAFDCLVVNGGILSAGKGVHVAGVSLSLPFLSDRDRADLKLACEMGADYIAASFTRSAADVDTVRRELAKHGGEHIRVIAKIENTEGVRNLDSILRVADGLMIARGDLGMDYPPEELPLLQKDIIRRSYSAGVTVITATQMLDSMILNQQPTRAEVCDVAGAIWDGTSAVMLSGETAAGQYPVEAVSAMARIALSTERGIDYPRRFRERVEIPSDSVTEAIAAAAVEAAHRLDAAAIVTFSRYGRAAKMLAKYRPACPIVCVTPDPAVFRQGLLTWGVQPVLLPDAPAADPFNAALKAAAEAGWMPAGHRTVAVAGSPFDAVRIIENP